MNAPNPRGGGLQVWAPSVVPPIGVQLSNEQALAVAFRHLAAIGFSENMADHITWQLDGQTDMFVNPWRLWCQEVSASDICGPMRSSAIRMHSDRCSGSPAPSPALV